MENITVSLMNNRERIETFLSQLTIERKYFDITIERIMNWKSVVIEVRDNKISAIAGIEKKFGMMRSAIVVKKEVQGKGLGERLLRELLGEVKKKYHIVWAIISEKNTSSVKLHLRTDYILIGNRQNLVYLAVPFDLIGRVLSYLCKILFPLVKVVDKIRH